MSKDDNIYSILSDLGVDGSSDDDDDLENWIKTKKPEPKTTRRHVRTTNRYSDVNSYINKRRPKATKDKHKHMLCKSTISGSTCQYGSKCLYAHSLSEQKLDGVRDRALKLIRGEIDGKTINIFQERDLYKALLTLCEMCSKCKEGRCTGGYNCREGACDKSLVVCSANLNKGHCNNPNCDKVHLTEKGLKPYFDYIIESQNMRLASRPSHGTLLTSDFFKKIKESKRENNIGELDDLDDLDMGYSSDSSADTDGSDGFYIEYDMDRSIFNVSL